MNRSISIKINLYELCLGMLALCVLLPRIQCIGGNEVLVQLISYLEIFNYFILFGLIVYKKYDQSTFFKFVVILAILLIGYLVSGKASVFRGALLILAALTSYESIITVLRRVTAFTVVLGLLLFILGFSPDTVHTGSGMAIGFGNPNQTGLILTFLYLLFVAGKYSLPTWRFFMESIAYAAVVFGVTRSKSAVIVIVVSPVILWISYKVNNKNKRFSIWKLMTIISFPVIFAFTVITAELFSKNKLVQAFDLIFTNRIFLNWFAMQNNPITLLGNKNVIYRQTGVYNAVRNAYNISTTIDCSYMTLLLYFGVIATGMVLIVYSFVQIKAWKNKDFVTPAISLLLSLYAFSESGFTEIYMFFTFFSLVQYTSSVKQETS